MTFETMRSADSTPHPYFAESIVAVIKIIRPEYGSILFGISIQLRKEVIVVFIVHSSTVLLVVLVVFLFLMFAWSGICIGNFNILIFSYSLLFV